MPRRQLLLAWGLVLCSGLWLHLPSARSDFLSEDFFYLEMMERGDRWEAVSEAASGRLLGWFDFYRPVAVAAIAVETWAFGTSPLPYHLVNLALILGCASFLLATVSRLRPERPELAVAASLFWIALPALVEPASFWATAPDLWGAFFAAWALWGFSRGSWLSLLPALLAYAAKESSFGLCAFLFLFSFCDSTPQPATNAAPPRAPFAYRSLGLAHLLLGLFAFAARSRILGGSAAPYGTSNDWGERLRAGVLAIPSLSSMGFGLSSLGLLVAVLALALRRGERLRPLLLLGGLLAAMAPALSLPLAGVSAVAGGRNFVMPGLALALVLISAGRKIPARWLTVLLVAAALGNVFEARPHRRHFKEISSQAQTLRRQIDQLPGDPLLIAGLPPSLQWAFPSSTRPPFTKAPRCVYPLRIGVGSGGRPAPCRPLSPGITLGQVLRGNRVLSFLAAPPAPPEDPPPLIAGNDGSFHAAQPPFPLGSLASLRLKTSAADATILLKLRLSDGTLITHGWAVGAPVGCEHIIPLLDLPAWSEAQCLQLRIQGVSEASAGPRLDRALAILNPAPGTTLSVPELVAPFTLGTLPSRTRALRVSWYNGHGGVQVLIPGRSFSIVRLHEIFPKAPVSFYDFVRGGCLMGENRVFLMVEALSDPKNPDSLLARTALTPYRVRLP